MTTVALLVDPPREGLVCSRLVETSPLSAAEAADLYAAMAKDVARTIEASGGELLVNYRPDDALPPEYRDGDAEREVRDVLEPVLESPDDARFEVQVGETFAGRAGNTVTHLLEGEGVSSAAVVEPTTPFLTRKEVDNAAMKLRRSEVILGPATDGRVYYAGFSDDIDFKGAYTAPAMQTLTDRARDAGHEVDFLPLLPVVETGADLAELLLHVRTRRRARRVAPMHTADYLDELELTVEADGGLSVGR